MSADTCIVAKAAGRRQSDRIYRKWHWRARRVVAADGSPTMNALKPLNCAIGESMKPLTGLQETEAVEGRPNMSQTSGGYTVWPTVATAPSSLFCFWRHMITSCDIPPSQYAIPFECWRHVTDRRAGARRIHGCARLLPVKHPRCHAHRRPANVDCMRDVDRGPSPVT